MQDSTRAVCGLLFIVSTLVTVFAWMVDRPDTLTWSLRLGGGGVTFVLLGLILKGLFQSDAEKDYLKLIQKEFWNRYGFCFLVKTSTDQQSTACFDLYFQSQYTIGPSARVSVRPIRNFWMSRAEIKPVTVQIDCPSAGFGLVRIPLAIPQKLQGQPVHFQVGATVEYPGGKGPRLRYSDGTTLHTDANFRYSLRSLVSVFALLWPIFTFAKAAQVELQLPQGVRDTLPESSSPEVTILWKLGDPDLNGSDPEA